MKSTQRYSLFTAFPTRAPPVANEGPEREVRSVLIEFLTLFLSVPVVVAWLLMVPLGRAYLAGIHSARDPSHRLTSLDAWYFFDRVVSRRLKGWIWIWAGAYLFSLATPGFLVFVAPDFWAEGLSLENLGICLMYADLGLSTALLVYASLLILAPRFEALRWLMVACLAVSLLVLAPILFAASLVFFRAFANVEAETLKIFVFGFALFPFQILILALALRTWARARGEQWFRIDESDDPSLLPFEGTFR